MRAVVICHRRRSPGQLLEESFSDQARSAQAAMTYYIDWCRLMDRVTCCALKAIAVRFNIMGSNSNHTTPIIRHLEKGQFALGLQGLIDKIDSLGADCPARLLLLVVYPHSLLKP